MRNGIITFTSSESKSLFYRFTILLPFFITSSFSAITRRKLTCTDVDCDVSEVYGLLQEVDRVDRVDNMGQSYSQ